jgi:hypothetical protein
MAYFTDLVKSLFLNDNLFCRDIQDIIFNYAENLLCENCLEPLWLIDNKTRYMKNRLSKDMFFYWKKTNECSHDWWICTKCRRYYSVHRLCQLEKSKNKKNRCSKKKYHFYRRDKIKEYRKKKPVFSIFLGQESEEIVPYYSIEFMRGYMNKDGSPSEKIREFFVVRSKKKLKEMLDKYNPKDGYILSSNQKNYKKFFSALCNHQIRYNIRNISLCHRDTFDSYIKKFFYYVGDKNLNYMDTNTPSGNQGDLFFYFKCPKCDYISVFS